MDDTKPTNGPAQQETETEQEAGPTSPVLDRLLAEKPDAVEDSEFQHGVPVVRVRPRDVLDVCRFLHDEPACRMTHLSSLSAVDMSASERKTPRFDVVCHLYGVETNQRLTLKVGVEDGAEVPSLTPIWKTANWHEREAYDMFGIRFAGHEDLRRILMPDEFDAFPLRKDFPLEGREKDHGYWRKPEDESRYTYAPPKKEA
jgi:NADH-quinone oxidoreductase subunit C